MSNDSIVLANELKNDYIDKIQFQLTKSNGFLILAGDNMLCTRETVNQGYELPLIAETYYVKNNQRKFESSQIWIPVPQSDESAKSDFPYIYLHQPGGGD